MTTAYNGGRVPEITLQHRLRIAREAAGLEQNELADRIGCSRGTIGNAEHGRTGVKKILLNAWAMATGVPVTWLETGEAPDEGPDDPDGAEIPPTSGLRIRSSTRRAAA